MGGKMKELFETYLTEQSRLRGWAERTVVTYRYALTDLLDLADRPFSPAILDQWLARRNIGPASRAILASALVNFCRWLARKELITAAELMAVEDWAKAGRRAIRRRLIDRLPPEEEAQAIRAAAHSARGRTARLELGRLRNVALIETLRSTGCRLCEILGLKVGDLKADGAGGRALVHGKGSGRVVFWDPIAWQAIQDYLAARGAPADDEPLFCRHDRRSTGPAPMTSSSVRTALHEIAKSAGLQVRWPICHGWRHRFVTRAVNGAGLAMAQELAGHSSPSITSVYTHLSLEEQAEAHRNLKL